MALSLSSQPLNGLPIELLTFIIDGLDRVEDIAALSLTNRRLYSTANPHLYKRAALMRRCRVHWPGPANRGLVSTLKMALDEWERVTDEARADATAGRSKAPWAMWDFNNRPRATNLDKWSSSPDPAIESDHADTPGGSTSTIAPSPRAQSTSDQDSVVSSEEDLSRRSDATPATEPSPTPTPHHPLTRRYYAIHLAARGGHDDMLDILISNGATVNVTSERFCACTPLYGLLNTLESPKPDPDLPLLLAPPPPLSPTLGWAPPPCTTPPPWASPAFPRTSSPPPPSPTSSTQDTYTLTPFYHAYAHRRWATTIPTLLALGADIHCEVKMYIPYTTITPLGEACRLGDFDAADRLLSLGADAMRGFVAVAAGGCLTPLHMCCMRSAKKAGAGGGPPVGPGGAGGVRPGDEDDDEARGRARMRTIRALIEKGARLDAQDCFGDTPLSAAEKARNTFALEALARLSITGDGGGSEWGGEEGGKGVDGEVVGVVKVVEGGGGVEGTVVGSAVSAS
ncbi:hypothetical protein CHGG_05126 [Chaetomium globosum CBS 148.51]|uniref:F-box domain-containing protein n=1 Tax=Chaetomium globosum (strain ATCC 6205 / CBS 148.51 / DSM 1962 / NBRC 6347 / NRRL 1970) TaxID=306901 RepID=Q2GZC0_CHAGB|nr:uncharacterized protein CHGG_05126 [Chaetomium globosum CBS 148.51]EAQ88507.1 hypothetical protein CHGG_05126 [Chaetomium globosum CBS 148.51]